MDISKLVVYIQQVENEKKKQVEMEERQNKINEGFICPSLSSLGDPALFMQKKDGSL